MNCVSSGDLSLKYKRFTPLDWQDISIRKFEFAAKTQFLYIFKIAIHIIYYLLTTYYSICIKWFSRYEKMLAIFCYSYVFLINKELCEIMQNENMITIIMHSFNHTFISSSDIFCGFIFLSTGCPNKLEK